MHGKKGGAPPPKSNDLEGWRQAITDGRLQDIRLEDIAAAFQDLRPRKDKQVENALANYLSKGIMTMLRGVVGFNHPNRGRDIILRAHAQIFVALLKPKSPDGKNLRVAFGSRVMFRMKDAIATEERLRRIPDDIKPEKKPISELGKKTNEPEGLLPTDISEHPDIADDAEQFEGDDASPKSSPDPSLLDGVKCADQQIDVDRFLEAHIEDPRKRLAFRLHMDGVPHKSKNYHSIAKALDVSEKTVREWIKDVRRILKAKVGELA